MNKIEYSNKSEEILKNKNLSVSEKKKLLGKLLLIFMMGKLK